MALLAAVARRASVLLRPSAAAVASVRRMSSSSTTSIRTLRDVAASLRAKAAYYRDCADAIRTSSHDGEVIRVIEFAMQSHDRSLVEEIPSDFPFKINKHDGLTDITLTRSFKGEQIEVLVSMPTPDQDEEEDSLSSSDGYTSYPDDNQEDECENCPKEYTIPLTVTVSKPNGSSLEFSCTAYPDKIDIATLAMRQPPSAVEVDQDAVTSDGEEGDLIASDEVVEFSELAENTQEALHKYLELRGINPVNTRILHEHMINKDRRQYHLCLSRLREFIKNDENSILS